MENLETIVKGFSDISTMLEALKSDNTASNKALDEELKRLGDKQEKLALEVADMQGRLDTAKAMQAEQEQPKSVGDIIANHDIVKGFTGGAQQFSLDLSKATALSPASNTSTRNTIEAPHQSSTVYYPHLPLDVEPLFNHELVSQDLIEYVRNGSIDEQAKVVAEGQAYSEHTVTNPTIHQTTVVNIGALGAITNQLRTNAVAFSAFINTEMQYKLQKFVNAQLLVGNGSSQLSGLMHTGNFTDVNTVVDNLYKAEANATNMLDYCKFVQDQLTAKGYMPQKWLLNPEDWTKLCMMKKTNGEYLLSGPQSNAQANIWGVPVHLSQFVTKGKFILGDFGASATIYDRQQLEVEISNSHADTFAKRIYTIRVDRRLGFAVKDPNAFVGGNFVAPVKTQSPGK